MFLLINSNFTLFTIFLFFLFILFIYVSMFLSIYFSSIPKN